MSRSSSVRSSPPGSTWHAAGGFHAINADMRIAGLQSYTIGLYPQIEEESGRSVGMHMSGGMELAGTPERMRMLKSELAWHRMRGTDADLLTPAEAAELVPIIDPTGLWRARCSTRTRATSTRTAPRTRTPRPRSGAAPR